MLTKSLIKFAERYNIEVCTAIAGEVHLIPNPDVNDCAVVAYKVEDDVLVFLRQWDSQLMDLPAIIKDPLKFKELIKYISSECS